MHKTKNTRRTKDEEGMEKGYPLIHKLERDLCCKLNQHRIKRITIFI